MMAEQQVNQGPAPNHRGKAAAEEVRKVWSHTETEVLLQIRAENAINDQITGNCRDSPAYQQIAERLAEIGFYRSRQQVKIKLKSLKKRFFKVKDANNTSGEKRNVFTFYDLCYAIWGHGASANPLNIVSSRSHSWSSAHGKADEADSMDIETEADEDDEQDVSLSGLFPSPHTDIEEGEEDIEPILQTPEDSTPAVNNRAAANDVSVPGPSRKTPTGPRPVKPPASEPTTTPPPAQDPSGLVPGLVPSPHTDIEEGEEEIEPILQTPENSTPAGNSRAAANDASVSGPSRKTQTGPRPVKRTSSSASHSLQDPSGEARKKKKKTKLEQSLQAVSSTLMEHLDDADTRHEARQDRRFAENREWEQRLEERRMDMQMSLLREMNSQTTRMIDGLMQMMSRQPNPPLYPHPGHLPYTYTAMPPQATYPMPTRQEPLQQQPENENNIDVSDVNIKQL